MKWLDSSKYRRGQHVEACQNVQIPYLGVYNAPVGPLDDYILTASEILINYWGGQSGTLPILAAAIAVAVPVVLSSGRLTVFSE